MKLMTNFLKLNVKSKDYWPSFIDSILIGSTKKNKLKMPYIKNAST